MMARGLLARACLGGLLGALCCAAASTAHAQLDDDLLPASHDFISSEHFVVEFRAGTYHPDMGNDRSFNTFFGGDAGPMLNLELDAIAFRVDELLYLTVGGSVGLSKYSGSGIDATTGTTVSEETSFSIIPLTAIASVRVDALARKLSVPFIFTGKLGWEWARWSTSTGARGDATGWSLGPYYAGEVALDLDTFEPSAARRMDEEWGINHSFVMFELYHFAPTSKSLPIGDTAWLVGLGFTF